MARHHCCRPFGSQSPYQIIGCIGRIAYEKFGDWNSKYAVLKAADYCARWREKCLEDKNIFVFETVFSAVDKIDFLIRAKEAGFFIRLFFISTLHLLSFCCQHLIFLHKFSELAIADCQPDEHTGNHAVDYIFICFETIDHNSKNDYREWNEK